MSELKNRKDHNLKESSSSDAASSNHNGQESKQRSQKDIGNVIKATASGFSSLVLLQFISKIFTFVLNVFTARFVSPEDLGVYNVQFQFLYALSIFLSRECFRRACARAQSDDDRGSQKKDGDKKDGEREGGDGAGRAKQSSINLAWLSFVASSLIAILAGVYMSSHLSSISSSTPSSSTPDASNNGYMSTVWLFVAGSAVELLAEPAIFLLVNDLKFAARATIEGVALFVRCVTVFLCVWLFKLGVVAFGVAQLVHGIALFLVSLLHLSHSQWQELVPSPLSPVSSSRIWFLPSHVSLVKGFFFLTAQKFLLTEGEKLLMLPFLQDSSFAAKMGVLALVSNLGSLVARFVLQPLEEMSFAAFASLHASISSASSSTPSSTSASSSSSSSISSSSSPTSTSTSSSSSSTADSSPLHFSFQLLWVLVRFVLYLGLLFLSFGPPYSLLLIQLLYGNNWVQMAAPLALSWYCLHVFSMAINGVTEAFVHATASEVQLKQSQRFMLGCSILYLALTYLLAPFAPVGLIIANSVNMMLRVVFNLHHILSYFKSYKHSVSLKSFLPPPAVILCFLLCALAGFKSEQVLFSSHSLKHVTMHVGAGACLVLVCAAVVLRFDREFVLEARKVWRQVRKGSAKNQ